MGYVKNATWKRKIKREIPVQTLHKRMNDIWTNNGKNT